MLIQKKTSCFYLSNYCSALSLGISQFSIHHFHLVQNIAAQLNTGTRTNRITPSLGSPNSTFILALDFKLISLFTLNALNGHAPKYLSDSLTLHLQRLVEPCWLLSFHYYGALWLFSNGHVVLSIFIHFILFYFCGTSIFVELPYLYCLFFLVHILLLLIIITFFA